MGGKSASDGNPLLDDSYILQPKKYCIRNLSAFQKKRKF